MDLKTRQALVKSLTPSYRRFSKKKRGGILTQLVEATGYHRTRASFLLNHPLQTKARRRTRVSIYSLCISPLKKIWQYSNFACGQRLVGMIPSCIETLERDHELSFTDEESKYLLKISSATLDRLLKDERKNVFGRGRSTTKPGTLLKNQIPIQVYTRWDDRKPGFAEVDLVAHCGPSASGEFVYTLDLIDLDLCWNECQAFLGRGERRCLKALKLIRKRLPVPLLGIDSDNGEEFINWHLYRWCQKNKITFTRCRPYRKNDQAHIEEKNWSVVRRYIGYKRYDRQYQVNLLNKLYGILRLYYNFFQANMRLERKERIGGKLKRVYSKSKTPYQRVLDHPTISQAKKDELKKLYQTLNPARLLREITQITGQLNKS